jgi:hypothetical protein
MKTSEYKKYKKTNFDNPEHERIFADAHKTLDEFYKAKSPMATAANGMRFTSPGAYRAYVNGGMK